MKKQTEAEHRNKQKAALTRNCGKPSLPFLRGDAAGFGPPFTVLIDKMEKMRSCSCVAESAMMLFQVNVVSLAKIAKAVGLMAGITSPHPAQVQSFGKRKRRSRRSYS